MILLKQIAAGIGGVALAIAGFFGAVAPQSFGGTSANPSVAAVFETSLAAPMGSSDTAFTLASVQVDSAGDTLAAGVTYPFTVDQGTNVQEFITATCVSTACTVVQRGLSPLTGTTTVTALKFAHRRGADVKITDWPTLGIVNNQINGIETIARPLVYSSAVGTSTISVNGKNLVDVDLATYLLTISGTNFWTLSTNNITNSNTGSVNIAKNLNILDSGGATSTLMGPVSFLGGTGGQPYVLIATGTPPNGYIPGDLIDAGNSTNGFAAINTFNSSSGACASSNFVMNGNIANLASDYTDVGFTNTGWTGVGAGCLSALTYVRPESTYIYNPTGEMDFALGTTTNSYGFNFYHHGVLMAAIDGFKRITLNAIQYLFPASQGAANTVLQNDGTGTTTWSYVHPFNYATTTGISVAANASATSTFFTFPAGTISASSTITLMASLSSCSTNSGTATCSVSLRTTTGATLGSAPMSSTDSGESSGPGSATITVLNNSSASSQFVSVQATCVNPGTPSAAACGSSVASTAVNLSTITGLSVVFSDTAGGTMVNAFNGYSISIIP